MDHSCHMVRRSVSSGSVLAAIVALAASACAAPIVQPVKGQDGDIVAVDVETGFYKARFDLLMRGATQSLIFKPLKQELRAEDYYGTHLPVFLDVLRHADPDPITGLTRRIEKYESGRKYNRQLAAYRIIKQDEQELVIEFEYCNVDRGGQSWMPKMISRQRIFFRDDSPAVRVEYEVVNTDAVARSVVMDSFNSASVGRVKARNSIFGVDGKMTDIDRAKESASTFMLVPEIAGDWIGGVNEEGFGVAYGYDWPDIDAMQICNWKTVGATYHTLLRRRDIPAGQSVTYGYWFMPFRGFGAFDGMKNDLVGGFLLGDLVPGKPAALSVLLASGSERSVQVKLECVRKEDGVMVLDETRSLILKTATTATIESRITFAGDALYVLSITVDDGCGTVLNMRRGIEVGRTRLSWLPVLPVAAKLGRRDTGENLAPPRWDIQFRTIDRSLVTEHLPLLCNHALGTVDAFFLTAAESTLCHVREIAERADIEYDYYAAERLRNPRGSLSHKAMAEFRRELKSSSADVFVALGINCETGLKKKLFREILRRVENGMGAVFITDMVDKQPLLKKALSDWTQVGTAVLPSLATGSAMSRVQQYTFGKGRIVLMPVKLRYYRDEGEQVLGGWTRLVVGGRRHEVPDFRWRGFEYGYAHIADLIRWAAGRQSPLTVVDASLADGIVNVDIINAGPPVQAGLAASVRTRRWEVCATGAVTAAVSPGRGTYAVKLDRPPDSGALALEVHARRLDGKVLAFGSAGAIVADRPVVSVTCHPQSRPAKEPGSCRVAVSGQAGAGKLRVSVLDRFGRVVLRKSQDLVIQEGKSVVDVDLSSITPVCVFHEIVADFFSCEPSCRSQRTALVFLMPDRPLFEDQFVAGAAGAPERKIKHIQGMMATCRRAGITMHTHSVYDPMVYYTGGAMAGYNFVSPRRKMQDNVMEPPVYQDEATVAVTRKKWLVRARKYVERGVRAILIDDERRLSGEYDWNPTTLVAFRRHLRQRYKDIPALNGSWGTGFADFESVMPKTRKEIGFPGCTNMAPWLEFRMFIGEQFGRNYIQQPAEWASELGEDVSVGDLGIYVPSPAWPIDWSKFARYYKNTGRYRGPVLGEYFRSFAPNVNHGTWQGYGMTSISPGRRIELWQSLFDGGHWVWFWEMRDSGTIGYAVCTSDLRVTDGYKALAAEELPDITGGLDRMIIVSRFTDDKIAIAYSYPSWLVDGKAHGARVKGILEELSYQFTYITLDDVGAGRLARDNYRLLIVPHTSCMSGEQVDGIRRYVEGGGTALFVGRTGWRNTVGSPHAGGSITDVLVGIDTGGLSSYGKALASSTKELPVKVTVASTGIAVTDAEILAGAPDAGISVPILTRRPHGKGAVFWLNSTLAGHSAYHTGGFAGEKSLTLSGPAATRNSHYRILEAVTGASEIVPRCRIYRGQRPVFGGETWYYESPSRRSLFVARYVKGGVDGPVDVRFPRSGHVYDLRTHHYFGHVNSFQHTFPDGRMQVYAVLDYQVTGLSAVLTTAVARPGATIGLRCSVKTDARAPDLHGIRVSVLGPDGEPLAAHRTVMLARQGRAELEIPLALNQPTGRYRVEAVDCVSGLKAQAEFVVGI